MKRVVNPDGCLWEKQYVAENIIFYAASPENQIKVKTKFFERIIFAEDLYNDLHHIGTVSREILLINFYLKQNRSKEIKKIKR